LIAQVREKRSQLRQKIMQGRTSELDSELGDALRRHWFPIVEVTPLEKEVVAVDGSRGIRPFASGAVFYVARALATYRKESFKTVDVDAFLSKGKSTDIEVFVNRKMEWLEFKAAAKAIEEGDLSNVAVLMDGSLFGRLSHLPRDQPAEGMRGFMVDYFETFHKLLSLSKERNILLLGVSKDSRSSFLRDYLLHEILERELKGLDIPQPAKFAIIRTFQDVFDRPDQAFESFKKLKAEHGEKLHKVEQIMWEAFAARTDHQLIRTYVEQPGHTMPIELSLARRSHALVEEIQSNPESYVSKHFKEGLLESPDPHAFMRRACEVLSDIPSFPTMISFHVLLDKRDTPIRVDVPSWVFSRDTTISEFSGGRDLLVNLDPIISILMGGYGGLKDYNIWLKRVDEKVRLSNDVMDSIYSSVLEKELDFTIIHTRGYRRVKYP
jgi:NurA domain